MAVASKRRGYMAVASKEAEAIWRFAQKRRGYMAVAPKKEAEVFRLLLKIGFTPINNSKRKKADIAFGTQD